jgi:cytochrome c551/c552
MNIRSTCMTILFAGLAIALNAYADERLSKNKGCASCHGGVPGVSIIPDANAPLMTDIRAKYKGQPEVQERLVQQLMECTKHPKVKTTDSERRKLVRFFLGLQ